MIHCATVNQRPHYMKNDLTFRHNATEHNFQFRHEGGNIKWRSWSDGDEPSLSTVHTIWILGETDARQNEKLIRAAMDSPRFTERDKRRVLKWFFQA